MIQFGNEWTNSQPCDGDIVDFVVILHNDPRTSPLNRGTEFYVHSTFLYDQGSPLNRGIQYYVHSIFLYDQGFATQERNRVLCTQYLLV